MQRYTITEWQAKIRALGVPATGPLVRPASVSAQWDLLSPYVGQPLSAIPRELVILFIADGIRGVDVATDLRALPPAERQVSSADEEVLL